MSVFSPSLGSQHSETGDQIPHETSNNVLHGVQTHKYLKGVSQCPNCFTSVGIVFSVALGACLVLICTLRFGWLGERRVELIKCSIYSHFQEHIQYTFLKC